MSIFRYEKAFRTAHAACIHYNLPYVFQFPDFIQAAVRTIRISLIIIQQRSQQFSHRDFISIVLKTLDLKRHHRRTKTGFFSALIPRIINRMLQRGVADSCAAILLRCRLSIGPQNQLQFIFEKILLLSPKWRSQNFQHCCFIQFPLSPLHQHFTFGNIQLSFCHTLYVCHSPAYRTFPGEQTSILTIAWILAFKLCHRVNRPAEQICLYRFCKTARTDLCRFCFHLGIQTVQSAPLRYSGKGQVKSSALFTGSLKEQFLKRRIPVSTAGTGLYLLFCIKSFGDHRITIPVRRQ